MKKKKRLYVDKTIISEKIREAFSSVIPISLIVFLLAITIVPVENSILLSFIIGSFFVVVGIGLFTLGADTAMTPIGEYVGKSIISTRKLWIILPAFLLVGIFITISEPDLAVLAGYLEGSIENWVLLITVGIGVGIFLVVAILRIVLRIKFSYLLIGLYTAIFVLAFFVPKEFVPLAFDSGGVTTGPMSVPFIIAIGTGVALLRMDQGADSDGFGLTALCSIGPILSVMILGVILKPHIENVAPSMEIISTSTELANGYLSQIPHYMGEVSIALLPIVAFFFITRTFGAKVSKVEMIKIIVGIVYTYIGLVLFLTGVNYGFSPMGLLIGSELVTLYSEFTFIVVPIGMVMGFFVVSAEPAVHVLTNQVYEITSGMVSKKALLVSLMLGTAASVGLAMLRILLKIDIIYFLIPGYLIALILTFFVPDIFTAIAFDSGGVASGAMTSGFLLPLALGVCSASGASTATEGFGLVAMVAMTPLIAIQILGLIYRIKLDKLKKKQKQVHLTIEQIIE